MGMGLRLGATALAAFLTLAHGFSLSTMTAEAAGQQSAAQARKTILSGIKAYERGDAKQSVSILSNALSSGGLTSKDMAKALYYRGRAYRKQGRHAQAISDLTSAIWLKNGLSESEKTKALAERAAAYKTAGVAAPVSVAATPSTKARSVPAVAVKVPAPVIPKSTAAATKSIATTAPKPAPVRVAQAENTKPAATAATPKPAANKPAKKAYVPPQPSSGDFTVGIPLEYQSTRKDLSDAPSGQARASGANNGAPSAATSGNDDSNPFAGVGTFFSNLFGDSSDQPKQAPAANFAGPQSQLVPSAGAQTAVSGWSSATTEIVTGSTKKGAKPTRVAALAQKPVTRTAPRKRPVTVAKPSKSSGKFGLQVAVLKTRGEAETVVAKLMQQHGTKFGNRIPSIDEQVFGNMGTFYRVKVGNYSSTREPKSVCSKIAKDGYDCFVVQK